MSENTFTKYTKYTVKELESYVADPSACVQKLEWTDLVSVLPKYLGNISDGVRTYLSQKIGTYDRKVDGVILAFKNTKILSPLSAIRPNSVRVHVKAKADFYIFRPLSGAVIGGTVKYVSSNYLSAVIYRVFNVTIKLRTHKIQNIVRGNDISFIVKSFDMKSDLPYIEGELIPNKNNDANKLKLNGNIKNEAKANGEAFLVKNERKSESGDSDSGIHEKCDEALDEEVEDTIPKLIECKKEPSSVGKERKRKKPKANGSRVRKNQSESTQSDDEMENSINAILRGFEKDISDTADSTNVVPQVEDSKPSTSSGPTKKKKKKKARDIEDLEAEILLKFAAQCDETESNNASCIQQTDQTDGSNTEKAKKRKKKKKSRTDSDADDFEASIMSSILKCAAEADERVESAPPTKKAKKSSRKSVRFDDTITEASFNAFDVSDMLEISQLHLPTLSSTLKDGELK